MQYFVRKMTIQNDQMCMVTPFDIDYSHRVIVLTGEIQEDLASLVTSELRALARESEEDITMYIQSIGGLISAGFHIYDTMQAIPCDVVTVSCGVTHSMAALLLAAGTKGKRWAQPHAKIMIHQPMGEVGGRATDLDRQVKDLMQSRMLMNQVLSQCTGQPIKKVEKDTMDDHLMTAQEALAYGIIDHVGDPITE